MLIAERPSEEKRAAKLSDEFESPAKSIKTMLGTLNCEEQQPNISRQHS